MRPFWMPVTPTTIPTSRWDTKISTSTKSSKRPGKQSASRPGILAIPIRLSHSCAHRGGKECPRSSLATVDSGRNQADFTRLQYSSRLRCARRTRMPVGRIHRVRSMLASGSDQDRVGGRAACPPGPELPPAVRPGGQPGYIAGLRHVIGTEQRKSPASPVLHQSQGG